MKIFILYTFTASDEIFIQEKINKGPNFISFYIKLPTKYIYIYLVAFNKIIYIYIIFLLIYFVFHIKNKCRIERILPSYNNIIVKIVKMLKVGKQNLLNNYLRKFYPVPIYRWGIIKLINLGYFFLLGYLLQQEYIFFSFQLSLNYLRFTILTNWTAKIYLYIFLIIFMILYNFKSVETNNWLGFFLTNLVIITN